MPQTLIFIESYYRTSFSGHFINNKYIQYY